MRFIRVTASALALALAAASCGDDGAAPQPTPEQTQAIGTLIDAELTPDEQRCILEEFIATGIEPEAILDGTITGDQDAELLAIAVSCVNDLSGVPAFVQSVIDASAESGTPITEAEAVCLIDRLADGDPATTAADCIGAGPTDGAALTYGDDPTLDLLWDACDGGNNQACDELYTNAPLGSGYLEFARSCAGRLPDSVGLRCFLDLG